MRIGYNYQSLKDADIDFNTKIVVNRFKAAIEKINKRTLSDSELQGLLMDIHTLMRNNDLGRSFYKRLISQTDDIKLLDFDNYCIYFLNISINSRLQKKEDIHYVYPLFFEYLD